MMKVTLVGLVIATVVDVSLGLGIGLGMGIGDYVDSPWIDDLTNLEKFKALLLPNPLCKLTTDCDTVKGVVIGIVNAKYKENSNLTSDCSCNKPDQAKCSCKVTFKPGNSGASQTYYEEVFLANVTHRVEAQYKIV
uniref:Uncharacterized protein n=1 Tax=Cacopsylla melanoneura TaxID=428564 RepID=A0A8D8Z420_9HEMI